MKKIISVLVIAVMLLGTVSSVGAEEIFDDTITESTGSVVFSIEKLVDQDNGISTCGLYYAFGTSRIINLGNYYVGVEGVTTATKASYDYLTAKCMIDQYRNGVWQQYDSHAETASRKLTVTMSYSEAVPSGYYYRCRTVHSVRHNGVVESGASMTGGIWIGK